MYASESHANRLPLSSFQFIFNETTNWKPEDHMMFFQTKLNKRKTINYQTDVTTNQSTTHWTTTLSNQLHSFFRIWTDSGDLDGFEH